MRMQKMMLLLALLPAAAAGAPRSATAAGGAPLLGNMPLIIDPESRGRLWACLTA